MFLSCDSETLTRSSNNNWSAKEDCWGLYKFPDSKQIFDVAAVRYWLSETWKALGSNMYQLHTLRHCLAQVC